MPALVNSSYEAYRERMLLERRVADFHRRPTQLELDVAQGLHFIVHNEFIAACARLPHFLLLPAKLLAILTWPVRWYVAARFVPPRRHMAHAGAVPALRAIVFERHPFDFHHFDFWTLHAALPMNAIVLVLTCVNEFALALGALNTAFAVVATGAGPLWMAHAPALVRDVVAGVAVPVVLALVLLELTLPFHEAADGVWGPGFVSLLTSGASAATAAADWIFPLVLPLVYAFAKAASAVPLPGQAAAIRAALCTSLEGATAFIARKAGSSVVAEMSRKHLDAVAVLLGATNIATPNISLFPLFPTAHTFDINVLRQLLFGMVAPFEGALNLQLRLATQFYSLQVPIIGRLVFNVARLVNWGPVRFMLWLCVVATGFQYTHSLLRVVFPRGTDPTYLYTSPFRIVEQLYNVQWRSLKWLVRLIQRALHKAIELYDGCLALTTRLCQRSGLIGDVLLLPASFAWMLWPLYYGQHFTSRSAYVIVAVACGIGILRGRRIIARNWEK